MDSSGGLLGALGPLLGSSWASLGHPWGTKMVPKRVRIIDPRQFFFATLSCIIYLFRFLLPLDASGAYLGRVLDPLGPLLGGFLTLWAPILAGLAQKLYGFLDSLPLFVFNHCGSPVIWYPVESFTHFAPLTF